MAGQDGSEKSKKRVLIVDDDPDIRHMVRAALEMDGFAVETAANGKEGLKRIAARIPDVIILDVLMPEMKGSEVARKLKQHQKTEKIPIIMLTALDDRKYSRAALFDLGVEFYIVKPFDMEDLMDKVRASIRYRTPE